MTLFFFNNTQYDTDDFTGTDGRGYNLDTVAGTGDTLPYFVAAMADGVADFANSRTTTSATSLVLAAGAGKTLTLLADIPVAAGMKAQIIDIDAPTTNVGYCTVTSYVSATKVATFDIDTVDGSGTLSNWLFVGGTGRSGPTGVAPDATETVKGIAELATQAETNTGTDDLRIVTPLKLRNTVLKNKMQDTSETRTSPSSSSGTLTLDIENGNVFDVTLTEAVTTLTISNPPATGSFGSFIFEFTQDGTGGWAITFPASVEWAGNGTAPTLTTTAGVKSAIQFYTLDAGTTWVGFLLGDDIA